MDWLEYLLPVFFLTPLGAIALVVLGMRGLHERRIQSPLTRRQLREPGQSLRDRLDEAFQALFLDGALGPLITLSPLVYGMGRMVFGEEQNWLEWAAYGLACALLVLVFALRLTRHFQRIRKLKLGLACELSIGQELDQLIRPEQLTSMVYHDVPAEGFHIDHLVVTPAGAYAIRTKARSRPLDALGALKDEVKLKDGRLYFPGYRERKPLRETRTARDWTAAWLKRECGVEVPVHGILALPGWKIIREGTQRAEDPDVVNGEGLAEWLSTHCMAPEEGCPTLDDALKQRINEAILDRVQAERLATS